MLDHLLEKVPELLEERARRYRVPGASLAVYARGETFECATGVVSRDTGVHATPDAVFQIGSITKIFTTTLVMQLVDEGRVELDQPVRRYLPELELGSAEAARSVTVRHLLTHTSGIDGDFFQDAGRGDDCVARYVLACSALGQLHPPGEGFSYCNAGFVLAGRIVEKLRGTTWDEALRQHLLDRIGADTLRTLPEELLYYRAAVGHVPDPEGDGKELRVAPVPFLSRSNGPAGATPYGAARDLLQLAKLHLARGEADDGHRVLSEGAVAAMQEWQVAVPSGTGPGGWGLGWMLFDWSGERVIGHDGGTIGHSSFLRVVPSHGVAVALLTNGGNTQALYRRVFDAVLGELCGVALPPLPEPTGASVDPARYVGTYERLAARHVVAERDGRLVVTSEERRGLLGPSDPVTQELEPAGDDLFLLRTPGSGFKAYARFLDFGPRGRARRLHLGTRTPVRVA